MLRKDKRGKMRVEDGVIRLYIDWRIGDVSDGASDPGRKEGRNLSLSLSSHIEAYWFLTTHHWMIFYENRTLDVQVFELHQHPVWQWLFTIDANSSSHIHFLQGLFLLHCLLCSFMFLHFV
ncbi:hypothetical protein MANES_01G085300v8 [Manihot esculenta]|uniref:Uncharacterized protein n=1 Tax=Manihot esculenta TaxID=3983 RepID=A0ACB7IBS5_MANES|nr:hypothetical protein MANES_01G085300v8 [Manihot esculenta]